MYSQCDECIDSFECVKVKSMLFPRKTISCSISSFSPVNIFILSIAITPPPPKPKYISRIQKTRFEDFIFLSQIFLCDMFDVLNRSPFFSSLFIIKSRRVDRVVFTLDWIGHRIHWIECINFISDEDDFFSFFLSLLEYQISKWRRTKKHHFAWVIFTHSLMQFQCFRFKEFRLENGKMYKINEIGLTWTVASVHKISKQPK